MSRPDTPAPRGVAGASRAADRPVIDVVFSEEAIRRRVEDLATEIAGAGLERLLLVPVLTGSFVFAADLMRELCRVGLTPEVDFLTLASYRRSTTSSGQVDILRDLELEVDGRDVLIVDDILESGRTLAYAKDLIAARGARRVTTCVLLDKESPRAVQIRPDFVAFTCPPLFVVGYGMDMAYRFRELPYVGHVRTSAP